MENSTQVSEVLRAIQGKFDAIDSYLCAWFYKLPLQGMEDVMGNYNSPTREDYTASQEGEDEYRYDLGEYIDALYRDFSEVNLDIKLNDFRVYAGKYANEMESDWSFIGQADFIGESII